MAANSANRPKYLDVSLQSQCHVCGEMATGHSYYGGISCFSCRTFFRRCIFKTVLNNCLKKQKCSINVETRAQCQYCRFQKCLKIGMDPEMVQLPQKKEPQSQSSSPGPSRGQPHCIDTMVEAKEIINNALHFLNWPEAKSRPFLNVSSLVSQRSTSPLAFTNAELNFIQNMTQVKTSSCQSIVYPTAIFDVFLDMAVQPASKSTNEWLPIGIKCHLEKMIKFATNLDFFQRLTERDQFMLLLSNTKMLQLLRMADFFKPGSNITEQMCFIMFEQKCAELPVDLPSLPPMKPEVLGQSLGENAMALFQQIHSIQQLELDETTLVLVMVIALLSTPEEAENPDLIIKTQSNLRHLLYRYLCTKMSPAGALAKVERIDIVLNLLMSSEDILMSKIVD